MPLYKISWQETSSWTAEVEASSQAEAEDALWEGELDGEKWDAEIIFDSVIVEES